MYTHAALQHFGSRVVGSPAYFAADPSRSGQSKIAKSNTHVPRQQQVAQFDVPVHNTLRFQVHQRRHRLLCVVADLWLSEPGAALEHLRQCAVRAQFQHEVVVMCVVQVHDHPNDLNAHSTCMCQCEVGMAAWIN